MAQYLHIRVEDIDLMLPALQVHEVIGLDKANRPSDGHAIWRDEVLAAFDLGLVLQRCTAAQSRTYGVVYSPDATDALPVLMMIDEVMGLRNPQRDQLHKLPGAMANTHALFDAIWMDNASGHKAYCVKSQLPSKFWA